MPDKILVTYASRLGSTIGVAEAIQTTLAESGAKVDLYPMQNVPDLAPYDAVVAGSAIREGAWLPEAIQFVKAHQAELAQKRFAIFTVCMTMTMHDARAHEGIMGWLDPVRALVKPVHEGYFAGTLEIDRVPSLYKRTLFRISVATGVWSEGDHRDWDAIRAWAKELKPLLGV
jgi:menaquinone-dependent protoporphyrinogen oxidase